MLIAMAIVFWVSAPVLHFTEDFWHQRLPSQFKDVVTFDCTTWNRVGHTENWDKNVVIARQVDETLVSEGAVLKIQSTIHWTTLQGEVFYETTGIYGVNRKDGSNVQGVGDRKRTGQFVFPPHTEKTTYQIWDAFYTGPRVAKFSHVEKFGPLEAYVFDCSVKAFDDTDGYAYLDDVPERYRAMSEGHGRVWVEPVSGVMLDFEDEGKGFLTDATTGAMGQYFAVWISRYTGETKEAHLRKAISVRNQTLVFEKWGPVTLAVLGLLAFIAGCGLWREANPKSSAQHAS